jgi:hypothetical protein
MVHIETPGEAVSLCWQWRACRLVQDAHSVSTDSSSCGGRIVSSSCLILVSIWARRGFGEREAERDTESRRVVTGVTARASCRLLDGSFELRSRSKEKLATCGSIKYERPCYHRGARGAW